MRKKTEVLLSATQTMNETYAHSPWNG